MSLSQFEVFCTVAEEKSLTKAAKRLHLSQPAVSAQIKALESNYQLPLFQRTNQGVTLTSAGEIVYQYAQQLIHIHEDMEHALDAFTKSKGSQLVVGASTVVGGYPLPCSIWIFKEQHPEAIVKLEVANSANILEKVKTAALDLAVIEGPVETNEIIVKPCGEDELVLITPYIDPWVNLEHITLTQLRQIPLILREQGSGLRCILEKALADQGLKVDDLQVYTEMGNLGSIKSAVEAGHGVSIVPRMTIRKEIYTKMLRALPITELDLRFTYKIIYHQNQILSDVAKAFIQLVTDPNERNFC